MSTQIQFAYIRYKYDKVCEIVPIKNIHAKEVIHNETEYYPINPTSDHDFSRTSWYRIHRKICPENCILQHNHHSYVKGNILHLGATQEDVNNKKNAKRVKYPVMNSSTSIDSDEHIRQKKISYSDKTVQRKKILNIKKEVARRKKEKVMKALKSKYQPNVFIDTDEEMSAVDGSGSQVPMLANKEEQVTHINKFKNPVISLQKMDTSCTKGHKALQNYKNMETLSTNDLRSEDEQSLISYFENEREKDYARKGGSILSGNVLNEDEGGCNEHDKVHSDVGNEDGNFSENEHNQNTAENVTGIFLSIAEIVQRAIEFYKANEGYGQVERSRRYSVNNNKIYLGEEISIECLTWELLQKQKPTLFLIDVAQRLWSPHTLANRALCLTRPIENIPSRSPVKQLEWNKLRLLISLYYDFLHRQTNISTLQKVEYLLKVTYTLRNKIRSLRQKAKKCNVNPRRHLRYNFFET